MKQLSIEKERYLGYDRSTKTTEEREMSVLKNGKLYEVMEEEYAWRIFLRRCGSVIVFNFGKQEFEDAEEVENYLKLSAYF